MKLFKRILFWCVIAFILFSAGVYVYGRTNGRQLAEQKLTELLGRQFRVRSINFFFPFTISMNQVEVVGVFHAQKARIFLSWPVVIDKQIIISRLSFIEPSLKLKRDKSAKISWGDAPSTPASEGAASAVAPGAVSNWAMAYLGLSRSLLIKSVEVHKGKVELSDDSSEKPVTYDLEDVLLHLRDFSYPAQPENIKVDVSGIFSTPGLPFSGSRFQGKGWINYIKKNMDAQITADQKEKGLALSAQLKSVDNDLRVQGKMRVDQGTQANLLGGFSEGAFGEFLLGTAQATNLKVDLGFSFQTPMDDFKMEDVKITGEVGYRNPDGQQPAEPLPDQKRPL